MVGEQAEEGGDAQFLGEDDAARIEAGPKLFNGFRDGLCGLAGNEGGGREGA